MVGVLIVSLGIHGSLNPERLKGVFPLFGSFDWSMGIIYPEGISSSLLPVLLVVSVPESSCDLDNFVLPMVSWATLFV